MAETVWHNSDAIGEKGLTSLVKTNVLPIDDAMKFPEWLERGVKRSLASVAERPTCRRR